jgi:hypothetical protein
MCNICGADVYVCAGPPGPAGQGVDALRRSGDLPNLDG